MNATHYQDDPQAILMGQPCMVPLKAYTEKTKHRKIHIIDATLREGAQAPGVYFNLTHSVEIARSLRKIGVDVVEIGHPYASQQEFERVQAVVAAIGGEHVLAHARAQTVDIEAVHKTGANWVSATVNGIGERVGITDTLPLMTNLHFNYQRPLHHAHLIQKVSQWVRAVTRGKLEHQQPIVGKHAFMHTSKLHQQFVERNHQAYEWIDPTVFDRKHTLAQKQLPQDPAKWITKPPIISATELKYHRHGPGNRYVMLDDRFVEDCRCYCIVRTVEAVAEQVESHVDSHRHHVDSVFLFLGNEPQMTGLKVAVYLDSQAFEIESPVSVFIPAGVEHTYKFISGSGLFINQVFADNYNESLLESLEDA
jgi:hypothetical protein